MVVNAFTLHNRKAIPLPVLGGLMRPVLAAEWELGSNWRRVPRLQLGLAAAEDVQSTSMDDGATLGSDGKVNFRKKVFVTRRWGVEVGVKRRLTTRVLWATGWQTQQLPLACDAGVAATLSNYSKARVVRA